MSSQQAQPRPRRAVTGLDSAGKSTIVSDGAVAARVERPGGATITEVWRADRLPARLDDAGPLAAEEVLALSPEGLAIRVCTFPPDSAVDAETYGAYAASLAESYGAEAASGEERAIPGMHRTDTVDVVTVLSGELWVVTENGETALRPGDSVVQRGTPHAWSNRRDSPATVVAIMMSASGAR